MQLKGIIRLISQISRVSQVSQKYVFADVIVGLWVLLQAGIA